MPSSAVGAVSYRTTPDGGVRTSASVCRTPPWARRSSISASAMAWLPPTGTGQPTVCASVASMIPAPAATSDGIREIVCAATPVNSARASSPCSEPQAGVPWRSIRSPAGRWPGCRGATTACRRGADRPRRRRCAPAARAACATTRRPAGRRRCARDRGRRSPRAGPAAGWRRRSPAPPTPTPRAARSNSAKNGEASASGWIAEQMSCRTPVNSGSGTVRAPPPNVGWASSTCTASPARAQMTAAANPLGPLPTTVTSTSPVDLTAPMVLRGAAPLG